MEEKERERWQDGVHSTRKPTSASACFCAQFKVYSSMTAEAEKAEGGGQVGGGRIRRAGGRIRGGREEAMVLQINTNLHSVCLLPQKEAL